MPRVRILVDYQPKEGWKVGDIVDITNPWTLIDEGKVVLVDDDGNPMERPGLLHCPICTYSAKTALDLAQHIIDEHPKKAAQPTPIRMAKKTVTKNVEPGLPPAEAVAKIEEEKKEEELSDTEALDRKEQIRRTRLANLAKARAAREAKKGV